MFEFGFINFCFSLFISVAGKSDNVNESSNAIESDVPSSLPDVGKVNCNTSTTSTTDLVEDWKPVRSKKNKHQHSIRAKDNNKSLSGEYQLQSAKNDSLFMMDEDYVSDQLSLAGRKKAFTNYDEINNELDNYEISDSDLSRLIIVAQTSRKTNEPLYDRTGEWTTRVKLTQDIAKQINDGLFYYEQNLWDKYKDSKQHKTLELISQEDFELYSSSPMKVTCTTPPPPTFLDEGIEFEEKFISGKQCLFFFYLVG